MIFIGILLFLLLRRPCENLKSYDNPFWGKSKEGKKKKNKCEKIPKIVAYSCFDTVCTAPLGLIIIACFFLEIVLSPYNFLFGDSTD